MRNLVARCLLQASPLRPQEGMCQRKVRRSLGTTPRDHFEMMAGGLHGLSVLGFPVEKVPQRSLSMVGEKFLTSGQLAPVDGKTRWNGAAARKTTQTQETFPPVGKAQETFPAEGKAQPKRLDCSGRGSVPGTWMTRGRRAMMAGHGSLRVPHKNCHEMIAAWAQNVPL